INTFINWGATVVIIGLMFKILHFKGGDWMIGVVLAVEALLFFIMGFMSAEKDVDWTRVFPELDEDYKGEIHTRIVAAAATPRPVGKTSALDKLLQDAKIDEDLIGNIGDGLRTSSEKVSTISKIANTPIDTKQFAEKLNPASK